MKFKKKAYTSTSFVQTSTAMTSQTRTNFKLSITLIIRMTMFYMLLFEHKIFPLNGAIDQ